MQDFVNPLRRQLAGDGLALGMNVRHSRTAEIGPILRDCGYAWMFLDDEHSPVDPGIAYQMALSALAAGVCPFVRLRSDDPVVIARALSNGALGVMVPHVHTAAQAVAAARASHYPPDGSMSIPGFFPQFGYRRRPIAEATALFNREVFVVAMIEWAEAVGNAAAIAAVDGIDALFVGASDLSYDMGLPGGYADARVEAAIAEVARAARAAGKSCGLGGFHDDAWWARQVKAGVRMVLTQNDLIMLVDGASRRAGFFRDLPR